MPRTKKTTTTDKSAPKPKSAKITITAPKPEGKRYPASPKTCTHFNRNSGLGTWERMPMTGANGRVYLRCSQCGDYQMVPLPDEPLPEKKPRQKKEPVKQQETLFDLSAFPVDPKYKGGRRRTV